MTHTLLPRTIWEAIRVMLRGAILISVASPAMVAIYVAVMVTLGLLPILQAWLAKLVLDALADGATAEFIFTLAVLTALALMIAAALGPVERFFSAWLTDRSVAEVDRALIAAGGRLVDLYRIERPGFADELRFLERASRNLSRLFAATSRFISTTIALIGMLILVGGLHPLLPVVLTVLIIPRLRAERGMQLLQYDTMRNLSRAAREMDYCARVTTEPAAAKEVRVFGLGALFLQRFNHRFEAACKEVTALRLHHLRMSSLFDFIHALALGVGFWYVASQVGSGVLTLGAIALYLAAITQIHGLLASLPSVVGLLYETQLHLQRLFSFLDQAVPTIALTDDDNDRGAPVTPQTNIDIREVNFAYPEGIHLVLNELTTSFPMGGTTALVGANGSGKSTLVKLLTRMYDPRDGEILLGGKPLPRHGLKSLRGRFAVTFQDFARFSLSLRENIAVGSTEASGVDSVRRAASWALLEEVARKLPKGLDTELTRRFEGGIELSGGEWQRIALARAFVRDASLVILDEPTAALDAEAEHRILRQFRELAAGKTTLIISHRLSTARAADRIVVIEAGRVVEEGSHDDLLQQGGHYAALFKMQAERYQ